MQTQEKILEVYLDLADHYLRHDDAGMRELYGRIGIQTGGGSFETIEARVTEQQARRERLRGAE